MTVPTYEQLQALVVACDPAADVAYWRSLFADGHKAELEAAYRQGLADLAAEYAADWRSMTEAVVHPERGAERRLRAAESGTRRDAAEHERSFIARARNTAARDRTDAQRGTVQLYPPAEIRRPA